MPWLRGGDEPSFLSNALLTALYVACLNLDSLSLILPEFLSASASIYRWLGTFKTAAAAGKAYDAANISQKGSRATTNFKYLSHVSVPRQGAETLESVRWDLLSREAVQGRKGLQCGCFQPTSHDSACAEHAKAFLPTVLSLVSSLITRLPLPCP